MGLESSRNLDTGLPPHKRRLPAKSPLLASPFLILQRNGVFPERWLFSTNWVIQKRWREMFLGWKSRMENCNEVLGDAWKPVKIQKQIGTISMFIIPKSQ
ncbi:unnamed protein product [Lactuca saligna]|uniref:Uncharacterized protein n=1 Tax=Lactuca saligna TaxID=75948 RepID=A0AA36DWA6_LACSI|nr:unnamed protein product [Lactuca saligna]